MARERRSLDELVVEGLFGPARQAVDFDERVILAGAGGRLPADDDALDAAAGRRRSSSLSTRWKNSKRTPRRRSTSYKGAMTVSPMPARIL